MRFRFDSPATVPSLAYTDPLSAHIGHMQLELEGLHIAEDSRIDDTAFLMEVRSLQTCVFGDDWSSSIDGA